MLPGLWWAYAEWGGALLLVGSLQLSGALPLSSPFSDLPQRATVLLGAHST